MLRYVAHHEIDVTKWDACVDKSHNKLVYALSWYLDIVSPNWSAIIKEQQGEYVAVMPLPVNAKFGITYIKQPIFAQQLGVFSRQELASDDWHEIGVILYKKFRFITRYDFNYGNKTAFEKLPHFTARTFATYHLDLRQGYDSIQAGYKKDRKWRVNKAKRNHLAVQSSEDMDKIISIFHESTASRIYGVVGEAYEYRLLRQLYQAAKARGFASLYEATDGQGQVLAMIMLFIYGGKIIYIFNASTPEGKNKGAISFLVDFIIQKYAGQNMCFDFESPEVENVAQFYASFGSEKVHFVSVTLNNLPAPVRWLKSARTRLVRYFAS